MSDAYTDGFCHGCGLKRDVCDSLKEAGMPHTERRARARGTGTFQRVLDITYTQIRLTEARRNEQTSKGG
jgi:hypothetical protein